MGKTSGSAAVTTNRVLPLRGQTVDLRRKEAEKQLERIYIYLYIRVCLFGWHASARLMNSSVAAPSLSRCPRQVFRAEACRARPNEKVRAQGFTSGQLLMVSVSKVN